VFISNPHPNPQSAMTCTTSAYFGSPRGLLSFDTVEVCGSSPHGPTISFSELASITSLGKAPIGSIKEAVRNYRRHFLISHCYDTCPPAGPLTENVRRTYQNRRFRIREYSV
jgi:hypothetical protein